MKYIFPIIGAYTITFMILLVYGYIRSKKINNIITEEINPDLFLYKTDRLIKKYRSKKAKQLLLLNKSAAYIIKGDFDSADKIFEQINPDELAPKNRALYYLNLFSRLRWKEKVDEAVNLYVDKENLFKKSLKYKSLNRSIKSIMAIYYYYTEDYEKSKSILNELLNKKLPKLYYSNVIYQYALLDIKEGNIERARERLLSAQKAVKNIYLGEIINEELKKL